jgi:hypothetical protein
MYTPYDAAFVADFKLAVPYTARRFDRANVRWIVAAKYGTQLRDLILDHFAINVSVPAIARRASMTTQLLDLRYIGVPKVRDDGTVTAYGWVNGGWTTIWPLAVLKAWFEPGLDDDKPGDAATLYAVLGIKRNTPQGDIKSAWRKMARRWHPDMSSDPDATRQMQRINEAYEILKEPGPRARYDAGLKLQAAAGQSAQPVIKNGQWRPPYRCGMVLAQGIEEIGRLNVKRILQWQDIVNAQGQILVSYWRFGDDCHTEKWV